MVSSHLKNMFVKMGSSSPNRGENEKNTWNHHLRIAKFQGWIWWKSTLGFVFSPGFQDVGSSPPGIVHVLGFGIPINYKPSFATIAWGQPNQSSQKTIFQQKNRVRYPKYLHFLSSIAVFERSGFSAFKHETTRNLGCVTPSCVYLGWLSPLFFRYLDAEN